MSEKHPLSISIPVEGALLPDGRKLFFKVYQEKRCTSGLHYVETIENCIQSLHEWLSDAEAYDYDIPVLEPVYMTQEEFDSLPDFDGF